MEHISGINRDVIQNTLCPRRPNPIEINGTSPIHHSTFDWCWSRTDMINYIGLAGQELYNYILFCT